ncbi:MAG: accessory gene regulator B family protein [Blautia hansenii]|uniref:accessory gene regulator B family protein n=1 Tax=Blautia hansenii TaxID=1322 RepID=UPI003A16E1C1
MAAKQPPKNVKVLAILRLHKHSPQKQKNNIIINYGTEILLEFFIKVFVLISVAIICSKTIETVIFYWYFQLLQKNSK